MKYVLNKSLLVIIVSLCLYGCNTNDKEGNQKQQVLLKDTITQSDLTNLSDSIDQHFNISNIDSSQTTKQFVTIKSISGIYKRTKKKPSIYIIKANRDTVIKCKEGTLLSIPANCFMRAKDQATIDGNIKLSVKEFYTISDMMMANLTTSSNGNMIETGGMINIKANAEDNNDNLILNKGKSIAIALPTMRSKNTDGMQLFNGVHDSTGINWEPRNGGVGYAQRWGVNSPFKSLIKNYDFLVFPEKLLNKMPTLISNTKQSFETEILMPIRDVIQYNNGITKSVIGYIDTLGILHGCIIGNKKQRFEFKTNYSSTVFENINVNIAVSLKLKMKMKANVNKQFFEKLFKMGKGKPDSLVATTLTFLPNIKKASYEKIKNIFKNAITISVYKKRYNEIKKGQIAYENQVKQLEATGLVDLNSANDYLLLNTQQLGWINCDRFYNNPNKADYYVKLNENTSLLIVFHNIRSIMSSDNNGIFHNVPLGEKVTIVALKTEKGKIMLAMHETSISSKPFENIQFLAVSINEYKEKLKQLNNL